MPTLRTSLMTSIGPSAHKRQPSCTTCSSQSTRRVARRHNRSRAPSSGWLTANRKATREGGEGKMTSKRAKKVDPQEHLSMEWDPPVAPLRIVRKFGLWLVVRVEERGTFYKTRKEARA